MRVSSVLSSFWQSSLPSFGLLAFSAKNILTKEKTDCYYFYPSTVGKVVNFYTFGLF